MQKSTIKQIKIDLKPVEIKITKEVFDFIDQTFNLVIMENGERIYYNDKFVYKYKDLNTLLGWNYNDVFIKGLKCLENE